MEAQENQVALPLRSHTILGVCEALGEDFRFNPLFVRVPLAASVLYSPLWAAGIYLALGAGRSCLSPARSQHQRPKTSGRWSMRQLRRNSTSTRRLRKCSAAREWAAGCLRSRRGLPPAPRGDRTKRGAGAAIARHRTPTRVPLPALAEACSIIATTDASSGSEGAGASVPARAAARSRKRRTGHQSPISAVAAPSAQPSRSDVASVSRACRAATRLASVSAAPGVLGSGPTAAVSLNRYRRSRSNASDAWASQFRTGPWGSVEARSRQARENGRAGCTADGRRRTCHGRNAGLLPSSSAARCEWRADPSPATRASWAAATLTGDCSTDRLIAIPLPLVRLSGAKTYGPVLTQGRKDEVYAQVSFRKPRLLPRASVNRRGRQARNCPSGGP